MIMEINYPDRDWQLYISKVNLDYFLKFVKMFEEITNPKEKKVSFWHDTVTEFMLEEYPNNKIRIEFSDEIVTIMFAEESDDLSKKELKNIAELINEKMIESLT